MMMCLQFVEYQIQVNGESVGAVHSGRGVLSFHIFSFFVLRGSPY